MEIDHVHFYIKDADSTRNWFLEKLGFQLIKQCNNHHTRTEIVGNGFVFFILSSPLNSSSPVAHYLKSHPSGVVDVAFQVDDLNAFLAGNEVKVLQCSQQYQISQGYIKWAKIQGWGSLSHTLIEKKNITSFCYLFPHSENFIEISLIEKPLLNQFYPVTGIDHVVLNVASGELEKVVRWYQKIFNFHIQQTFDIKTELSGLYSKVLSTSDRKIHFNINEPTSANSQIQEFLDVNRGSGIQHIALQSANILQTVMQMRSLGLQFLDTPDIYYKQLKQQGRSGIFAALTEQEWIAIETAKILVDWSENKPESLLMQIFTKPIFDEPTFFFEFIERRFSAQGFGEGNFKALFEAIENEQIKRNSY